MIRRVHAGWWGIAFVVLLFISAAMASLPTAADPDAKITAFYRDHGAIVTAQQVLGAIALAPFAAFALSLKSGRWLRPAVFLFVAVELVTNIVPLVILGSPTAARSLTVVEDLADGVLFVATAIFVIVASLEEPLWLRVIGYLVAAACVIRAVASPLGVTALDQLAPLAFVGFMLMLSVRLLVSHGAPLMTRT